MTCSGGNCNQSTKPSKPSRSCSATSACPSTTPTKPIYSGTWRTSPAASCPTTCGQSAITHTGAVYCSGGDCDPDTEPSELTRSCSATSACITACSNKPANSTYTDNGMSTNNSCTWACDSGYHEDGDSCEETYPETWRTNQQAACSTACGQSAITKYGSVYCSGGNCDQRTKPSTPSRRCGATTPCCTGSWIRTSAPSCPTCLWTICNDKIRKRILFRREL